MPHLQTVTDRSDRIASLDILRGFALLGMIIVHFHQAFRLTTPGIDEWPGESLSGWVIWWGMEGKAAATFAFLFGVGFAVILRRADQTGRPVLGFYLRRLLVLALFGVLVEAFTGYSILIHLAISGLWLLLFRRFSARTLVLFAVIAALAQPLYVLGAGLYDVLTDAAAAAPRPLLSPPQTYWQEVQYRLTVRMPETYKPWNYLVPTFTVSLFLLGMAALRRGVFDDPKRHVRLIIGAMSFGAICWLIFWLLLPKIPESWYGWHRNAWPIRYGMGVIVNEWLALTYVGAILLLLAYRPWWTQQLAAFGTVGRLGLTNYVAQAAIIYYLKSDFGLALQLRPHWRIAGALLVFSVLVLLSYAWLTRFTYGPLEWVWRALSRLSLPELRRVPTEPRAVPAYAIAPFAAVAVAVPLALATGAASIRSGVKELPPASNLGFEAATLDPWEPSPDDAAELDSASAHTGRFAGKVTKERGYLSQQVGGLLPRTTYTVRAWMRAAPGSGGYLYVKNHGRPEVRSAAVSDSAYTPVTITFTMGRSRTTAEVGVRNTGDGDLWVDDVEIDRVEH